MDHITKKVVDIKQIKFERERLFYDAHDSEVGVRSPYFKNLVDTVTSYPQSVPPIFVDINFVIIDGHHRYLAHRLLGLSKIIVYQYWKPYDTQLPYEDLIRYWKVHGEKIKEAKAWTANDDLLLRQLIKQHLGDNYSEDEIYYIGVFPYGVKGDKSELRGLRIFFESESSLSYPYSSMEPLGEFSDDIFDELLV